MAAIEEGAGDHPQLEADHTIIVDPDGNDSAYGSDLESNRSASITSSIVGYKYENGRRYHAYREGSYYLPNDEAEQARLDLVHHIFTLALDGALYAAPLPKDIKRCLDFGTGTGIWAIDFADEFPEAEVVGTDLSPIQPNSVPPNLNFYVDDVESDWSYRPTEHFDFIHGRSMGGALNDWNRLSQQIFDNLKPGGWCGLDEYEGWIFSKTDSTLSKCPDLKQWMLYIHEASSKFGKELDMGPKLKELMRNSGFVNVQEKVVHIPIGQWAKGKKAKEMGSFQRAHILDCVDSYTMALFTRVLGWTREESEVIMAKAKNDIRDPQNQLYTNFWFVWGQKPEA